MSPVVPEVGPAEIVPFVIGGELPFTMPAPTPKYAPTMCWKPTTYTPGVGITRLQIIDIWYAVLVFG
jgi:hypothetical protein